MQQQISLRLLPSEASDDTLVKKAIAQNIGKKESLVTGYQILKHSIDARGRTVWANLTLKAFIDEPFEQRQIGKFYFQDVSTVKHQVIIIGAGPAGLFAALKLIELGIRPIILERGKDVRSRRRDLAALNKTGIVNPESNYCFGEGGAGTYSDGKLYTRSTKRGDVNRTLQLFYHFGAAENVLYETHPHIGTNKLPQIITTIRQQITDVGGIFLFEKKVVDFVVDKNKITEVITADGDSFKGDAVILATGHSARDIFELLHRKNILIEAKPFALGVRIEHPQSIIDSAQYHCAIRNPHLPPAAYSLVQQVNGRGVFSFCMCPGGIIAPAATSANELVVNGWSPSKRNNPYANSGMVVQVGLEDVVKTMADGRWQMIDKKLPYNITNYKPLSANHQPPTNNPLLLLRFQQMVEQKAFAIGGGNMVAPAQRLVDFTLGRTSVSLPNCSYNPGLNSVDLSTVLPSFVHKTLQEGFKEFGKKMKGYFTNEAVIVATESRTSSPVRIPRDAATLHHPQILNLYPCAEGAGYAGGIVSAAMDGERVAEMVALVL